MKIPDRRQLKVLRPLSHCFVAILLWLVSLVFLLPSIAIGKPASILNQDRPVETEVNQPDKDESGGDGGFVFEPLNAPKSELIPLPPMPKFPAVVAARMLELESEDTQQKLVPLNSSASIVIEKAIEFEKLPPIPGAEDNTALPVVNAADSKGSQNSKKARIALLPENFIPEMNQFQGVESSKDLDEELMNRLNNQDNQFQSTQSELPMESNYEELNNSRFDSLFLSTEQLNELVRNPLLSASETQHFDLVQAIEILLRHSPLVRVAELEVDINKANVVREDATFDWSKFIETTWAENNQPVASTLDGAANRIVNHDLDISAGLRRQNRRGGNFSIQQDAGLSDSNSSFFTPQNQADANIAIEYQHPLLQGGGRLTATSRFEIANVESLISEADLVAELQRQIVAVATAYWNLVNARGEFIIRQRTLELGKEILTVIENRVGVDTKPEQLIRARANYATRQQDFLRAKFDLLSSQERLLQLMFGSSYQVNAVIEVVTTAQIAKTFDTLDLEQEMQVALQNRPEIRSALSTIERASIEQGVARNQLLPVLDLTLSLSNRGIRGEQALASAFNEQFSFGDPTYAVALSYLRPQGNRAAKAGMDQATFRLMQFQQQLEQSVSEVALDIKLIALDVLRAYEQLDLAEKAFQTATRDYSIRLDRYELMLDDASDVTNYLDNLFSSQDRLAAAQRTYIQALSECSLVNIRFQNARGTLTNSIPLSDRESIISKPVVESTSD